MNDQLKPLPDDAEALKALVREQEQALAQQSMLIKSQSDKISKLEHHVHVLNRMLFGKSSEKRPSGQEKGAHPNQGHLFYVELLEEARQIEEDSGAQGTIDAPPGGDAKPRKKGGRRKHFPPHLPVIRTTYVLEESDRKCDCGGDLHEIGEEVRKELERLESTLVHEIVCKKYGCRKCSEGVKTAPGPDRVIEKGILGKGFLAQIVVERFGHHMPYHRLEKKYFSEGLELSRSVLQRSMTRMAELLEPISDQLRKEILSSPVLHTDDTPVTIARTGTGGSQQGRIWVYCDKDGRYWYDFTDSRKQDRPLSVLAGYRGWVQADAYPGYDRLFYPEGSTEVGCWAHVRRKFIEAEKTDPDLAKEVIDQIRELFAIERNAKEMPDEERRQYRQEKAKPKLDALQVWLELKLVEVLPKSPLAKAIHYALNQWAALNEYLADGRLAIDNNAAERALRPFAVGRKNWLFFQQDTGGKTAAILMSLLMTAKEVGLDPRTYFRDVLMRIAKCSDVTKLTPHGWKEHFAEEVAARRQELFREITGQG